MIRLTRPEIGDPEIEAVTRVLQSGMLVQGAEVAAFEALVAARVGRRHAIAVANGTAALELALCAVGVAQGDEVLCPDLTWPSPGHAIALAGAVPVLVDVDAAQWNVTAAGLAAARTARTRVAVVVDQFGVPAAHPEIAAALPGVTIIEDAACAIGSVLGGRAAGSFGAVSCLSFHPRKLVTTGEGGMCLTDDDTLAARLRILRNHGQSTAGVFAEPGPNERMTELAAALGAAQLARLDTMIAARSRLADRYRDALPELGLQAAPATAVRNWQTLGALLPEDTTAAGRDTFLAELRARDVEAGRLSYALHRIDSLARFASPAGYPVTEALVDRGVALPLHGALSDADQARVIDAVRDVLRNLAR